MKRILFCILIWAVASACATQDHVEAMRAGNKILDCWLEREEVGAQRLVQLESHIEKITRKKFVLWDLIHFILKTESAFREYKNKAGNNRASSRAGHNRRENSAERRELQVLAKPASPRVLEELANFRKPAYGVDIGDFDFEQDVAKLIEQIKMRGRWRWAKELALQMRAQPQDPYAQDRDELLRVLLEMFSGTMSEIHDILRVGSGVKLDDFRTKRGQDFYNWALDQQECGLLTPANFAVLTQPLSHEPFDDGARYQVDHIRVDDYCKRKALELLTSDDLGDRGEREKEDGEACELMAPEGMEPEAAAHEAVRYEPVVDKPVQQKKLIDVDEWLARQR
jgi:hypothetical protein